MLQVLKGKNERKTNLSCHGGINTNTQLIPPKVIKDARLNVFCSEQRKVLWSINTPSPPCFPHSELAFHNLSIYSTHESKDLTTSSEWCLEMGALPLCKGDKGHLFPIKIFTDFFNLPGSTSSGVRGRGTSSSGILFATANNHKKDIVLFWVLLWWRLAVGNCGLCDLLPLCH